MSDFQLAITCISIVSMIAIFSLAFGIVVMDRFLEREEVARASRDKLGG